MLCWLLNDWSYFWNKHCNLLFLAICCSHFPLLIFLASSWFQKAKLALRMSLRNEKKDHMKDYYHLNNFIKQFLIEQSPTFLSFSFLIDCCMGVFLFTYQSVCKFWKIKNISSVSFHVYENGENLKIMIKIYRQKLIVSDVVLAFLDHL